MCIWKHTDYTTPPVVCAYESVCVCVSRRFNTSILQVSSNERQKTDGTGREGKAQRVVSIMNQKFLCASSESSEESVSLGADLFWIFFGSFPYFVQSCSIAGWGGGHVWCFASFLVKNLDTQTLCRLRFVCSNFFGNTSKRPEGDVA